MGFLGRKAQSDIDMFKVEGYIHDELGREKDRLVSIIYEALREIQKNLDVGASLLKEDPSGDWVDRTELYESALGLVQGILSNAISADKFTTKAKSEK